MKKLNYFLLGAASLMLASCSQDDLSNAISQSEGNFNVTVSLPKTLKSRAVTEFGQGYEALQLNIAVYDGGTLVETNVADFPADDLSTTCYFNLAKGKSYEIVFFAQSKTSAEEGVYSFDAEAQTMTVDYGKMTSGSNLADYYDCFYNVLPTGTISSAVNASIELFRPVGQVNWGTNDLTDAEGNPTAMAHDKAYGVNGQYIMTNLSVAKPYTVLNLLSGEVSGNDKDVKIEAMAAPYTFTFPLNDTELAKEYKYVAMTYILAPKANSTTYDLNLDIDNSGEPNVGQTSTGEVNTFVNVSSVPVQANFQTNIYGNLLSENVSILVTKNPEWETPDYDIMLGMEQPEVSEDGEYLITSLAELNWVADQVNSGANNFAQKTVSLQNDIVMAGAWTPIGSVGGQMFQGTFNGNGHTISNMNATGTAGAGLFGNVRGNIQDVNLENATVSAIHYGGVVVGYIYGSVTGCNVKNSSVTVTPENTSGSTWDNGNQAAIIAGYVGEGSYNITGNSVADCTVQAYRDLGGIAGTANKGVNVDNNTVSGLTLYINNSHNYKGYEVVGDNDYSAWNPGAIVGRNINANIGTNTDSDVEIIFGYVSSNLGDLAAGAASGETVYLDSNITGAASQSYGYGSNKAGLDLKGGTIEGNGNTLTITGATTTWDCAIYTTGGTINDLTVEGAFRAIFCNYMTTDLVLNNVNIYTTGYGINVNEAALVPGLTITANNCTIRGWNSWAGGLQEMIFNSSKFNTDSNYKYIRPYFESTFNNCVFQSGWEWSLSFIGDDMITMNNCTMEDGTVITADNFETYFSISDIPTGKAITDVINFVN